VQKSKRKDNNLEKEVGQLEEKLIRVRRVFTVVKGGRTIGFNALVVLGNREGRIGLGLGKAKELVEAIRKGRRKAEKSMICVSLKDNTIPHEIIGKYGAAQVLLKPASSGTGLIAGEAVRAVVELAGVRDISSKCLRSHNPLNVAKATFEGLRNLRDPGKILQLRKRRF